MQGFRNNVTKCCNHNRYEKPKLGTFIKVTVPSGFNITKEKELCLTL